MTERYQLGRLLGEGLSGKVYEAWDSQEEQLVTVKMVDILNHPTQSAELLRSKVQTEVELLSFLQPSPHLPVLLDFGPTANGQYLIVTEHLPLVRPFHEVNFFPSEIQRPNNGYPRFSVYQAVLRGLEAYRQLFQTMAEVHAQGVVHRDLKGPNLLVQMSKDGTLRVLIIDWDMASFETKERTPGLIGTISHMAPELFKEGVIDQKKADVYSLGVVLYKSLNGVDPYFSRQEMVAPVKSWLSSSGSPRTDHQRILDRVAELIRQRDPPSGRLDLPELNLLVEQLLSKKPQARPSMEQGVKSIEALMQAYRQRIDFLQRMERTLQEVNSQLGYKALTPHIYAHLILDVYLDRFPPTPSSEESPHQLIEQMVDQFVDDLEQSLDCAHLPLREKFSQTIQRFRLATLSSSPS